MEIAVGVAIGALLIALAIGISWRWPPARPKSDYVIDRDARSRVG